VLLVRAPLVRALPPGEPNPTAGAIGCGATGASDDAAPGRTAAATMGAPGSDVMAASAPCRIAPAPRLTMSLKETPVGGVTRTALSVETTSSRLMPGAIRVSMLASV